MTATLNGISPLPHLGVIRAQGEDAAKFLHGQLTQDFALLGTGEARLAAFLSAKGRMQASFIGFKRDAADILLVCSRDVLPATLKRLSMFVMRAKCTLSDASGDFQLLGLAGESASSAPTAWSLTSAEGAHTVQLYPADGVARALWVAPNDTPAPAGPVLDPAVWRWGEVRSGVATVTAPLFEAFVPQMLNYESIGGVNFKKGCYPGQEIVARSQFRGVIKRRLYLAQGDQAAEVGAELFKLDGDDQPCGLVVDCAARPGGGFDLQISAQIEAAQAGELRIGAVEGSSVALQPAPYPLLEDI